MSVAHIWEGRAVSDSALTTRINAARVVIGDINTGWKNARRKAGVAHVRVHDLKHTFGQRSRAAGVSFEDRQDLLGHRSARITTHYSAAELSRLLEAANRVCGRNNEHAQELIVLRGALRGGSRKTPANVVQC
jgi:integrase